MEIACKHLFRYADGVYSSCYGLISFLFFFFKKTTSRIGFNRFSFYTFVWSHNESIVIVIAYLTTRPFESSLVFVGSGWGLRDDIRIEPGLAGILSTWFGFHFSFFFRRRYIGAFHSVIWGRQRYNNNNRNDVVKKKKKIESFTVNWRVLIQCVTRMTFNWVFWFLLFFFRPFGFLSTSHTANSRPLKPREFPSLFFSSLPILLSFFFSPFLKSRSVAM